MEQIGALAGQSRNSVLMLRAYVARANPSLHARRSLEGACSKELTADRPRWTIADDPCDGAAPKRVLSWNEPAIAAFRHTTLGGRQIR